MEPMRNVLSLTMVVLAAALIAEPRQPRPTLAALPSNDRISIPVCGVLRGQLKCTFYEGRVGHIHHAIDILAKRGTPVLAAVDGRVRKMFLSRAGGITLYEWDNASTTSYYYAHLDRYAAGVHEGQTLHRGELIGYVGTTGNAPPGTPHLHFQIETLPASKEWLKGVPVDPYPILVARGVTESAPR